MRWVNVLGVAALLGIILLRADSKPAGGPAAKGAPASPPATWKAGPAGQGGDGPGWQGSEINR